MNWRKYVISMLLSLSGSNILKYLSEIKSLESLSTDDLKKYQRNRISHLLNHAYHHSPYYRQVFSRLGIVTNGCKVNLDKFNTIPPLTKSVIRKAGSKLYSNDHFLRGSYANTSGGSTGEPVQIIQDKHYYEWNVANKLFYAQKVGKTIGEKEVKLWGSERDILEGSIGIKEKLSNWLYNRKLLNSFMMTEEDLYRYVRCFNRFKPKHVWSYVDSIFQLAKFVEQNSLSVHSPNSIIVTAGVLSEDIREFVERVFNSKVYNQYGSREVGDIAAETQGLEGLQSFMWSHYLEVVNGELLVTCLTNFSMPLIRYQIGDYAQFIDSNKKVLANIKGRITNSFKLKDGTIVHGEYFTHLFYFKPWVKRFKVIQRDYDDILCNVELSSNPIESDIQDIVINIKKVMGDSCKVEFVYVDEIIATSSGKYLYTESYIK